MNKLLSILGLLAFTVTSNCQTVVNYYLTNFAGFPATNRTVKITPQELWGTNQPLYDVFVTNVAGNVFSRPQFDGKYMIDILGPPSATRFWIAVTNAGPGVNANQIMIAVPQSVYPPGVYSWSITASDARYAPIGASFGGNAVAPSNNITIFTTMGTNYISATIDPKALTNNDTRALIFSNSVIATSFTGAHIGDGSGLTNLLQSVILSALGYTPLTNSYTAITNTLGYGPVTNTFQAVTNALGYLPATNNATIGTYLTNQDSRAIVFQNGLTVTNQLTTWGNLQLRGPGLSTATLVGLDGSQFATSITNGSNIVFSGGIINATIRATDVTNALGYIPASSNPSSITNNEMRQLFLNGPVWLTNQLQILGTGPGSIGYKDPGYFNVVLGTDGGGNTIPFQGGSNIVISAAGINATVRATDVTNGLGYIPATNNLAIRPLTNSYGILVTNSSGTNFVTLKTSNAGQPGLVLAFDPTAPYWTNALTGGAFSFADLAADDGNGGSNPLGADNGDGTTSQIVVNVTNVAAVPIHTLPTTNLVVSTDLLVVDTKIGTNNITLAVTSSNLLNSFIALSNWPGVANGVVTNDTRILTFSNKVVTPLVVVSNETATGRITVNDITIQDTPPTALQFTASGWGNSILGTDGGGNTVPFNPVQAWQFAQPAGVANVWTGSNYWSAVTNVFTGAVYFSNLTSLAGVARFNDVKISDTPPGALQFTANGWQSSILGTDGGGDVTPLSAAQVWSTVGLAAYSTANAWTASNYWAGPTNVFAGTLVVSNIYSPNGLARFTDVKIADTPPGALQFTASGWGNSALITDGGGDVVPSTYSNLWVSLAPYAATNNISTNQNNWTGSNFWNFSTNTMAGVLKFTGALPEIALNNSYYANALLYANAAGSVMPLNLNGNAENFLNGQGTFVPVPDATLQNNWTGSNYWSAATNRFANSLVANLFHGQGFKVYDSANTFRATIDAGGTVGALRIQDSAGVSINSQLLVPGVTIQGNSPTALQFTNSGWGNAILATDGGGNVQPFTYGQTWGAILPTLTSYPTVLPSIWFSNSVFYFVTATKTNLVSDGR